MKKKRKLLFFFSIFTIYVGGECIVTSKKKMDFQKLADLSRTPIINVEDADEHSIASAKTIGCYVSLCYSDTTIMEFQTPAKMPVEMIRGVNRIFRFKKIFFNGDDFHRYLIEFTNTDTAAVFVNLVLNDNKTAPLKIVQADLMTIQFDIHRTVFSQFKNMLISPDVFLPKKTAAMNIPPTNDFTKDDDWISLFSPQSAPPVLQQLPPPSAFVKSVAIDLSTVGGKNTTHTRTSFTKNEKAAYVMLNGTCMVDTGSGKRVPCHTSIQVKIEDPDALSLVKEGLVKCVNNKSF